METRSLGGAVCENTEPQMNNNNAVSWIRFMRHKYIERKMLFLPPPSPYGRHLPLNLGGGRVGVRTTAKLIVSILKQLIKMWYLIININRLIDNLHLIIRLL